VNSTGKSFGKNDKKTGKLANMLSGLVNFPQSTPVFRVFRTQHFIKSLKKNENVMVRPHLWDDPFENLTFNRMIINFDILNVKPFPVSNLIRDRLYGQCWTLNCEETDALWRIYSPKADGVRIKSTIGRLFAGLYDETDPHAEECYFIGKVNYLSQDKIVTFIKKGISVPTGDLNLLDKVANRISSGKWAASTLLVKRTEFQHENELRLIYESVYLV
jgi:hypothetical protein